MDGRGIDSLTCQAMQTTTFAHASRFAPSILSFRRHHLRTCIHPPPPNNFHHWPCNRTGVTLSPHLSLRAPPIPAHSRRRLIPRLLTRKDWKLHIASKDTQEHVSGNHGARRKSPRYCQSPRCAIIPWTMPLLLQLLARARPRTGLLTSSSTAPLPRQPPAQWYASMSSSDMAFAPLPPLHWQPSRTTGHAGAACPGNRGRGYGWPLFSQSLHHPSLHIGASFLSDFDPSRATLHSLAHNPPGIGPSLRSWSPGSMACTRSPLRNSLTGPRAL
jgi:hypothetical protein